MGVTNKGEHMSEELQKLDQSIDHCRVALSHKIPEDTLSLLQTFHVICEELRYLELIHRKMHMLRTSSRLKIGLVIMKLEESAPQSGRQVKSKLASVFDFDNPASFNLHRIKPKHLTKDRLAKGQAIALVVGEGVIELDWSMREYLKRLGLADTGPLWPDYLNKLTWLHNRALLDYLQPSSEERKPYEELVAREVLSVVEKDQECHGSIKLSDDLRHMNPPLTWGEVIYHFLHDPQTTKGERGEALREFLSLFNKRYCLECDELFTASKSSLSITCPRCSSKLRKRRERERKKQRLQDVRR